MYQTKYRISFLDIEGQQYTINIQQDGYSGSITELTAGVPPIVVNYDSESDFLYNPLRLAGATINVILENPLTDLFATSYQQYKVNLLNNSNNVLFTGYIIPETYSQDYLTSYNFPYQMECVSALATTEYFDFDLETDTVSIFTLIQSAISKANGDYSNIYLPKTYGSTSTNVLKQWEISRSNFIDEDDNPMNYKEIIEEVCKFLGWTITEKNGNIYFIDADYISKGNTSYWRYNNTMTSESSVTLSSSIDERNIKSKGNNDKLTILGGYNKVSVVCSDYEAETDELYPTQEWEAFGTTNYVEHIKDENHIYRKYWCYKPTEFNFRYWVYSNGSWRQATTTEVDADYQHQLAGVFPIKTTDWSIDDMPNSLTYENALEIHQLSNSDTEHYLYQNNGYYPMIELADSYDNSSIIIDNGYKFAISFQLARVVSDERVIYPVDAITGDVTIEPIQVPFKFQIGDYYYNGTKWVTDSSATFNIPVNFKRAELMNTYCQNTDTNSFVQRVDKLNGYIVNIDRVLIGKPRLTVYNPIDPYYYTILPEVNARSYFIKDIELQCQKIGSSTTITENGSKKDTLYTNVVNEDYINECEDIELKITSKNDSELSYSKVMYNNSFLDTIDNRITNTEEKPERITIQRVINQYSSPKIKLNQSLENVDTLYPYSVITNDKFNSKFLITNEEIDYRSNTNNLTLIELN